MYICKPAGSSQGKGIFLSNDIFEIREKVYSQQTVVQQYIDNPLLINKRKFDLRVYVLITSMNPLRIYMYKEGLARFATVDYSYNFDTLKNRFIHLTNYSINKNNKNTKMSEDFQKTEN